MPAQQMKPAVREQLLDDAQTQATTGPGHKSETPRVEVVTDMLCHRPRGGDPDAFLLDQVP